MHYIIYMSCDRCSDVHAAQKAGLTRGRCECDCHNCTGSGTFQFPYTTWCNDTTGGNALQLNAGSTAFTLNDTFNID